jgi:polysaccharide pyruvyl transferase WcaK-like protein
MKTIPALIDMLVDIARLNDCFIADGGFVSAWVAGLRTALLYAGSTVYVWVQRLT